MNKIIPAPLTNSIDEFHSQFVKLIQYFSYFQIDVADNKFVPNYTTQLSEMVNLFQKHPELIASKDLLFDYHLMVEDYEKEMEEIKRLAKLVNSKRILIHSVLKPDLQRLQQNYPDFQYGLVINPPESIDAISQEYDLDSLPFVQIMTVRPGFQKGPFILDSFMKVEQLRLKAYKGLIMIDGGVNKTTLPTILSQPYQPDFYCIGSYITRSSELKTAIEELKGFGLYPKG